MTQSLLNCHPVIPEHSITETPWRRDPICACAVDDIACGIRMTPDMAKYEIKDHHFALVRQDLRQLAYFVWTASWSAMRNTAVPSPASSLLSHVAPTDPVPVSLHHSNPGHYSFIAC